MSETVARMESTAPMNSLIIDREPASDNDVWRLLISFSSAADV